MTAEPPDGPATTPATTPAATPETARTAGAPAAPEPSPGKKDRAPRWRRFLVATLVVVGCVLAPISVAAVWIHGTLLDTDQYVSTIGPLASNSDVQQAAANRVTNALVSGSNLEQRIKDALPSRAAFAVPSITQGIEQFVHRVALKFAQSDTFSKLWSGANRRAHSAIVALLQGKGTQTVATKNGQVTVDLSGIISKVRAELEKRGVSGLPSGTGSRVPQEIVLVDSTGLKRAQSAVDAMDKIAIVLPILTVLAFAIALWLSSNRRRTLLRAGLGVAFAVGIVLVALGAGRSVYLDALGSGVNRGAAGAVYDQLLTFLKTALRTVFAVGIVVAVAAWLAGPGRYATRIREGVVGLTRRGGGAGGAPSPVAAFVARHRAPLRVLVVGVGLVVLVLMSHPGPWTVLIVALVVVAILLLLEFVANRAAPAPADA